MLSISSLLILQAGDGYLAGLAARFSSELNLDEDDVMHQLEDLRSAATSNLASEWSKTTTAASKKQPPPVSAKPTGMRLRRVSSEAAASEAGYHNYANMSADEKDLTPGIYAVIRLT